MYDHECNFHKKIEVLHLFQESLSVWLCEVAHSLQKKGKGRNGDSIELQELSKREEENKNGFSFCECPKKFGGKSPALEK